MDGLHGYKHPLSTTWSQLYPQAFQAHLYTEQKNTWSTTHPSKTI